MKLLSLLIFIFLLQSCTNADKGYNKNTADSLKNVKINRSGNNIKDRIPAPDGYQWVEENQNSFESFLQNIELKPHGSPILDYNLAPISNQSEHVAVLNFDVGKRDLQQCADAVIRLRAEYLYETGRHSEIGFHFTSGDMFRWEDYKNGYRAVVNGNSVSFEQTQAFNDTYASFRKYLDAVYAYAGSISLNKETNKVINNSEIKAGDILITPGSPGHAIIIVGRAVNGNDQSVYLLAEGYTPAQSIHIITNPSDGNINPWYKISVNSSNTQTARYNFSPTNIKSFR